MPEKKLIIFDFDGVLVNTSDLCYSLHVEQNPGLTFEQFSKLSMGNFLENIERATREEGFIYDSEAWHEKYNELLKTVSTHDVIRILVIDLEKKYLLSICSSMHSGYIREALDKEDITKCFSDILGSDIARNKVFKIEGLLKKYDASPADALFITDTLGDIRDGTTCGVATIGVTWGNHDRETLAVGNPYAIVDTVPELEAAIETFFRANPS